MGNAGPREKQSYPEVDCSWWELKGEHGRKRSFHHFQMSQVPNGTSKGWFHTGN